MNNSPTLIAHSGPYDGTRYPLKEGTMMLGSQLTNDIRVDWDGTVSRKHARIEGVAGLFWLVDLDSRNGSYLWREDGSEERLQANKPALLVDGKWLRLGKYALFQVIGLVKSNQAALRQLYKRLQKQLHTLKVGLNSPNLAPELRREQEKLIAEFTQKLSALSNEADLLHFVAEGIPTIDAMQNLPDVPDLPDLPENNQPSAEDGLPPWEDDDDWPSGKRIPTPRNIFLHDIYTNFPQLGPNQEDNQGDDRDSSA